MLRWTGRGWRQRLPWVGVLAALIAGTGCDEDAVLKAVGADDIGQVEVVPAAVVLEVGRSTLFVAEFAGRRLEMPSWSSSAPDVVSIDASGTAKCLKLGNATVGTCVGDSSDPTCGRGSVECVAPKALELSATTLEHVHTIGESPCPDEVGRFTITNRSLDRFDYGIDPGNGALRANPARASLEPGESVTIVVLFDCSVRTPITLSSELTVTATSPGREPQSAKVAVALTIPG